MKTSFGLFAILFVLSLSAQKKNLKIDDFNHWYHISASKLSDDGKCLVYERAPGHGDGELIIHNLVTEKKDTLNRAFGAIISEHNKVIAFKIKPQLNAIRSAKLKKASKNKVPKDSLGVWRDGIDSVVKFPKVLAFSLPEEGPGYVAFTSDEKFKNFKDTAKISDTLLVDSLKTKTTKPMKGGKTLVVFYPENGDTVHVEHVNEFKWSKSGDCLWVLQSMKDSVNKIRISSFDPLTKTSHVYFEKEGDAKKLTLDKEGRRLVFFFSTDTVKEKIYSLYGLDQPKAEVSLWADTLSNGMRQGFMPSPKGACYFSEDGRFVYFGIGKKPVKEPVDSLMEKEKALLDIWSWTDKQLQPRQKIKAAKEKNRTYISALSLRSKELVILANEQVKDVRISAKGTGRWVLGFDDSPYLRSSSWSGQWLKDVYKVDVKTGVMSFLARGLSRVWLGPSQKNALAYEWRDSTYYCFNLSNGKKHAVGKSIDVPLYNELNDVPNPPSPYGIAGWGENDEYCFIYDRYDLWQVDLKGDADPINLTNGRVEERVFRLQKLDVEKTFYSLKDTLLLSVFSEKDKRSGFAYLVPGKHGSFHVLVLKDVMFGRVTKAKQANTMLYANQTFQAYPNLCVSPLFDFDCQLRTDINPQQENYNWGTVELVDWTDFNGIPRQGLLYKPEDFDPLKKYPMMVYFYERSSNSVHRHNAPSPSRSIINKTFYTSNGYLVFVPDISYRTGYPGKSAYDCIMSGVTSLTERYPFVDQERMGLQGQSWGGYQIAYLVTQTDLFAAAMAGAPVSNMTSAYGGIRWGSGMSRMFQYEHTQSRIGESLWDNPSLYIDNSPLFYADKVNTPLLMMSNDKDDAVPWYQGIEFFVALRRLDKKVWMLSYNNEPHNLKAESWGNRMDLSLRMKQFFDHYLKGEDAPEWLLQGRSAIDKTTNMAY